MIKMFNQYSAVMLFLALLTGCSGDHYKDNEKNEDEMSFANHSENEFFTISYPKDWVCNDEGWGGRDAVTNEMDLFPSPIRNRPLYSNATEPWLHCVKSFMHFEHKSAKEAAAMSIKWDSVVWEKDGLLVDGYPAYLTVMVSKDDVDTVVHRQYVVLIPCSYTVFYFTANYSKSRGDTDCAIMEKIISSIRFKPEVEWSVDDWLERLESYYAEKMQTE